jgi:hypothetical protein
VLSLSPGIRRIADVFGINRVIDCEQVKYVHFVILMDLC